MRSFVWICSIVSGLFFQTQAHAAACCGGGFSAPAIISGDEKAKFSTSYSASETVVESVDTEGIWTQWGTNQRLQTLRLEAARVFWDRYQFGVSIPVLMRSRANQSYSGLGDISTTLGYEVLPDWDYNPWRPKGIGFIQLTLPTGKAKADSEVGGLDSRGNGFWALGAGGMLSKSWDALDVLLSLEVHRSFSRRFANSQLQGTLEPGTGGSLGFGGGYSWGEFRLGSQIVWSYEDAVRTTAADGLIMNEGFVERYATASVGLSYRANDEWSGTLSYTDQTLFGSPVNTSLGRGLVLLLQRSWAR